MAPDIVGMLDYKQITRYIWNKTNVTVFDTATIDL